MHEAANYIGRPAGARESINSTPNAAQNAIEKNHLLAKDGRRVAGIKGI